MRCNRVRLAAVYLLARAVVCPILPGTGRWLVTTQELIAAEAARQGVPQSIALAVANKESGYNQAARGAAGEVGVYQLMPATARDLGVNPADEAQNIQGGISYLRQLYSQFGSWLKALAAYNGGPTAMAQGKTPAQSWTYAQNVLGQSQVIEVADVPGDYTTDIYGYDQPTQQASSWSFGAIPNWAWLAGLAGVAALVLLKRD